MKHAPKLLPWFAHKAGISIDLAAKLWRRASGEAALLIGNDTSSDFHRMALERFIDLVEDESQKSLTPQSPYGWVWRSQNRIATHSFVAANLTARWWNDLWQRMRTSQTFA